MGYITVSEAAKKWGISDRRVRLLCSQDRIEGVIHKGRKYLIPIDAEKPVDERTRKSKSSPSRSADDYEKVYALKEELSRKKALPKKEVARIRNSFIEEFTYNSNAIDGNSLTQKEVIEVLNGNVIPKKPLSCHMDAVGTKDAFLYVQECVDQKVPLSENIIKNIHSLVLVSNAQTKGRYRTQPLRVKDPYVEPVDAYMIKSRMNDLIFENNRRRKMMAPLERIARFHLDFKSIRPFADANGRTNRLILNFELMQEGFPPIDIKHSQRKQYLEAFDSYYRDKDLSPMISIIVHAVEEALEKQLSIQKVDKAKARRIHETVEKDLLFKDSIMYNNPIRF